jgi:hypothetical protein
VTFGLVAGAYHMVLAVAMCFDGCEIFWNEKNKFWSAFKTPTRKPSSTF